MFHILDIIFLFLTASLSVYITYKMFFSLVVKYYFGGIVFFNIGFWSAIKAIDQLKGDTANFVDFQQDFSLFLALITFSIWAYFHGRHKSD